MLQIYCINIHIAVKLILILRMNRKLPIQMMAA